MRYFSVQARFIVKSDSPSDAELHVRRKIQPVCAAWYEEDVHIPAVDGGLMHYCIESLGTDAPPAPESEEVAERFDGLS